MEDVQVHVGGGGCEGEDVRVHVGGGGCEGEDVRGRM